MPLFSPPASALQSHTTPHSNDCVCCNSFIFPTSCYCSASDRQPSCVPCAASTNEGVVNCRCLDCGSGCASPGCARSLPHHCSLPQNRTFFMLAPLPRFTLPLPLPPTSTHVGFQSRSGPGVGICCPRIFPHCVSSSALSLRYCKVPYIATCIF